MTTTPSGIAIRIFFIYTLSFHLSFIYAVWQSKTNCVYSFNLSKVFIKNSDVFNIIFSHHRDCSTICKTKSSVFLLGKKTPCLIKACLINLQRNRTLYNKDNHLALLKIQNNSIMSYAHSVKCELINLITVLNGTSTQSNTAS